jgi:hypothetical protein
MGAASMHHWRGGQEERQCKREAKLMEKERVVAALISRHSSPRLHTIAPTETRTGERQEGGMSGRGRRMEKEEVGQAECWKEEGVYVMSL